LILHITFFGKKTSQKQATATLQNLKTHASSMATQILRVPHTGGLHPPWHYLGDHLSVVALRHYDSNIGQITLNKYQTWQRVDGGSECIYDYPDDSDRCHHLISWGNAAGGPRYSGCHLAFRNNSVLLLSYLTFTCCHNKLHLMDIFLFNVVKWLTSAVQLFAEESSFIFERPIG